MRFNLVSKELKKEKEVRVISTQCIVVKQDLSISKGFRWLGPVSPYWCCRCRDYGTNNTLQMFSVRRIDCILLKVC